MIGRTFRAVPVEIVWGAVNKVVGPQLVPPQHRFLGDLPSPHDEFTLNYTENQFSPTLNDRSPPT